MVFDASTLDCEFYFYRMALLSGEFPLNGFIFSPLLFPYTLIFFFCCLVAQTVGEGKKVSAIY